MNRKTNVLHICNIDDDIYCIEDIELNVMDICFMSYVDAIFIHIVFHFLRHRQTTNSLNNLRFNLNDKNEHHILIILNIEY